MAIFVLHPDIEDLDDQCGKASRSAMFCYAENIESVDPELAKNLRIWATKSAGYTSTLCPSDDS